ncbi:MAG: ATP-binding protein [Candidatus Bipolaricaulia bacterium]
MSSRASHDVATGQRVKAPEGLAAERSADAESIVRFKNAGKLLATLALFGLALGAIAGFNARATPIVFALLAMSMLTSAMLWEVLGGVIVGAAAAALAVPFLPAEGSSLMSVGAFAFASSLAGGGIGYANRRERRKRPEPEQLRMVCEDVFKRSLNPMLMMDPSGRVSERNDRAIELLGSVKHLSEFIHLDDLDDARADLERAVNMGESDGLKLRAVSWDKKPLPSEIRMRRIGTDRIWVELADRSEESELERKLWETEARYRYLIEDAIDTLDSGIVLLDRDRQIVWANRTLGYLFNVDRDELIGADLKRMLQTVGDRVTDESVPGHILSSDSDGFVFTLNDELGERILEYRSIPVETERYQGGRIDHFIDLTEIKKLERELVEKTERLEASNKKLEEFSHVVSHDLKQPLRTIQAFSQFLEEDYREALDEEGAEYLDRLKRSSERMKSLIDDLLKLSSIEGEHMEPIDVGDLMIEVREDLEALLADTELVLPQPPPPVLANRTRLSELFGNLISNAIRYNDKDDMRIEIDWEDRGNEVVFAVSDNGMGIEERYRERIFELFERLSPGDHPESTGAGLAICKRIVEEFGGRIWLESELGEGSTFYFSVPKPTSAATPMRN